MLPSDPAETRAKLREIAAAYDPEMVPVHRAAAAPVVPAGDSGVPLFTLGQDEAGVSAAMTAAYALESARQAAGLGEPQPDPSPLTQDESSKP